MLLTGSLRAVWICTYLALISAGARTVLAQPVSFGINGRLVSPVGKPPCAFCQVQLESQLGRTGMTLASGSGEFHFLNLTENVYRVSINSADYEEISLPVILTAGLTEVSIDLQPKKSQSVTATGGEVMNVSSALEFQSKDVVALYRKALKNRMRNRFADAVVQYESLSQTAPQLYIGHFDLGIVYQEIGRLADAAREFQIARQLDTSSVDPLIHLGEVYILRGEWGFAAEASVHAIRRNSKKPQPYFYLGLSLYCNGMPDLAKDSLWRAVDLDPKLGQARLLLANIYLNERDDRSALEQLDLYFSKAISNGRPAGLSALRAQLKKGAIRDENLEIPVPIKIGSASKTDACRVETRPV